MIIAHEDTLSFGYGAEIAARIADELFTHLDAPVKRVAAMDTWVGYHPQLEAKILPQTDDLAHLLGEVHSARGGFGIRHSSWFIIYAGSISQRRRWP